MASINSISLHHHSATSSDTATTSGSASSNSSSAATTSTTGSDALANQNTFLQLLVAQLQYQDPTQPVDGTTFVTQLAQFSDLQQNVGTREDLDAISKQYLGTIPSAGTGSTSSGTSTTSGTSSVTGS